MAQGIICQFNKFGFCKFGNKCIRKHENKLCEHKYCEVKSCPLRHPRKCRFFLEFNCCKFGTFCRYRHEKFYSEVSTREIEDLRNTLECLKEDIAKKNEEIRIKDKEMNELKDKNIILESENKKLKQKIEELKDSLESKTNIMAENDMIHLDFIERVRDKYGYSSNDEESEYESDNDKRDFKKKCL